MLNLTQARRRNATLGEPIHMSLKGLADHGVTIRMGQVTMVAAPPGAGKSALVQALLHHGAGARKKNSTMYFSADSGPEVIYERAGALSTQIDMDTIRQLVRAGNTESIDAAIKAREGHITYDFTGSPSQEHVLAELSAYLELHGQYPEVLVMDNLKDLADDQDSDEFRALEDAVMFLKDLARETEAAVLTLHHVGGAFEDSTQPIPLSGLRGKVSKTPALVLTMHRPSTDEMRVSVVKNRNGKADASGMLWVPVEVRLSRMEFRG